MIDNVLLRPTKTFDYHEFDHETDDDHEMDADDEIDVMMILMMRRLMIMIIMRLRMMMITRLRMMMIKSAALSVNLKKWLSTACLFGHKTRVSLMTVSEQEEECS